MAARETVDVINSAESAISGDIGQTPIKLAAEVCGLGPVFQICLTLVNMSTNKIASNLCILIHSDQRHYLLEQSYQKVGRCSTALNTASATSSRPQMVIFK